MFLQKVYLHFRVLQILYPYQNSSIRPEYLFRQITGKPLLQFVDYPCLHICIVEKIISCFGLFVFYIIVFMPERIHFFVNKFSQPVKYPNWAMLFKTMPDIIGKVFTDRFSFVCIDNLFWNANGSSFTEFRSPFERGTSTR